MFGRREPHSAKYRDLTDGIENIHERRILVVLAGGIFGVKGRTAFAGVHHLRCTVVGCLGSGLVELEACGLRTSGGAAEFIAGLCEHHASDQKCIHVEQRERQLLTDRYRRRCCDDARAGAAVCLGLRG